MPNIVTDEGLTVQEFRLATVAVKDSLDDETWNTTQHLYCDRLTLNANGYDEAELTRFFGDMVQPGTDFFASYPELDYLGKFVRITIPQAVDVPDIVWVGYVVAMSKQRSAVKGAAPAAHVLTGKEQSIRCVGLEYFLDRVQIDSSVVYSTNTIKRVIPFNAGQGVALDADTRTRANRSATSVDSVYQFAADEEGDEWTLEQTIKYLLRWFQSENKAGDPSPTVFTLDATDVNDGVLSGIAPTLNPDGMTVFQCLNKLLAPQRGFVWWLEFDQITATTHRARIRVETITDTSVTLPSGGTVPANRDQQTLDFDKQRDVEDVVIAEMGSRIYHQVIARGARMTSTVTLGNVDSATIDELVHGWAVTPEDMEAGYQHAAASDGDYPADEAGQKNMNDAFRQGEKWYRVYSSFILSPDWDGKSGDGSAGTRNWSLPTLSNNGSIIGSENYSKRGLRILNHTRLKRGWDYSDASAPVSTTIAGTEAEYMPLFAILQVEGSPDRYQFADKISENTAKFDTGTPVSESINIGYHIHADQTNCGIILNAAGAQHACALNHWSGAEPTNTEPQVDYETLRVTCALEADTYCEHKYPSDSDLPSDIPLQKLLLYCGGEYRLDFLAANTVVDLENGVPVLADTSAILRDDRPDLKDIARLAYEWYQQNRRPLSVKFKNIRNVFRLGMLITTIGAGTTQETVNTVVSMITYDCENSNMTIVTNDEDLDLGRLA